MQHPTAFTRRPPERRVPPPKRPAPPQRYRPAPLFCKLCAIVGTGLSQLSGSTPQPIDLGNGIFMLPTTYARVPYPGSVPATEQHRQAVDVLKQTVGAFRGATSYGALAERFSAVVAEARKQTYRPETNTRGWNLRTRSMLTLLEEVIKEYESFEGNDITQQELEESAARNAVYVLRAPSDQEALLQPKGKGLPEADPYLTDLSREELMHLVERLMLSYGVGDYSPRIDIAR